MKIRLFTIPNLLTLSNLLCGSFAVVSALSFNNLNWAFWLIVLAALFDFLDGFVARLLHCPSEIGVQLDSLSDMISFGLAPSAILYVMFNNSLMVDAEPWIRLGGGALCFLIAAFSALRLAKFNIDETQHTEFCGLPTPANALFFAALGWMQMRGIDYLGVWTICLVVPMAWLLISPIRMFALKFKGFGWAGNQIRYSFLLIAALLVLWRGVEAVPAVILLYILVSTVRWILIRKHA